MVGCCEIAPIVARRLKDSQKKNLVEGYRSGESTTTLAKEYGCSQNTVIRTVKAFLPLEEYKALKAARSKGEVSFGSKVVDEGENFLDDNNSLFDEEIVRQNQAKQSKIESNEQVSNQPVIEEEVEIEVNISGPLALDDADDFLDDSSEDSSEEQVAESKNEEYLPIDVFQEVVPLTSDFEVTEPKEVTCKNLGPGVLPDVVYLLVDRSVELDARPLKEFPELGLLPKVDQDRQALCLFPNQRAAKRNCGRSQRVIKVPDTDVFGVSKSFLLARGITRLVLEGVLIALDEGPSLRRV